STGHARVCRRGICGMLPVTTTRSGPFSPGKSRASMAGQFPVIHEVRALRDRLELLLYEQEQLRHRLTGTIADLHEIILWHHSSLSLLPPWDPILGAESQRPGLPGGFRLPRQRLSRLIGP